MELKTILENVEVGLDSSRDLLTDFEEDPECCVEAHAIARGYIKCLEDIHRLMTGQCSIIPSEDGLCFELIHNPFNS